MARRQWIWMAAAALACACTSPPPRPAAQAASEASAEADYASPPELKALAASADGGLQLSGAGRPNALVRLASPDGTALGAAASNAGVWSLNLQPAPEPRLYSVSEDVAGRPLRARGYLAVWSSPRPGGALLRPGSAAALLSPARGLAFTALDFDVSGAAIASGADRPNEEVRLSVDGAEAGPDRADAEGRFVLSLPRTLSPGSHVLTAEAGGRRADVRFEAAPAARVPTPPFAARRQGQAWRIDWMTPGGGVQTTLLFDPAGGAP